MKYSLLVFNLFLLLCLNCRAETDAEMIKRIGLDPRSLYQGQFDPGKLPGLAMWLRGDVGVTSDDAGHISAWTDPDRGQGVEQTVAANQPLLRKGAVNGQAAVHFEGGPIDLNSKEFKLGGKSLSVIVVTRVAKVSFFGGFLNYGPVDKSYTPSFRFAQYVNSGKVLLGDGAAERCPVLPGRGFTVLEADFDAATHRFTVFENGVMLGSVELPQELPESGPITLGANLVGDLTEVMIFNTPVNSAVRAGLTAYLNKKYELASDKYISPLASLLPFAYYPSSSEIEVAFDTASPLLSEYFGAVPSPPVSPANTEPGLSYAYYTDKPQEKALPDFTKLTPQKTGVAAGLSLTPTKDGGNFAGDYRKAITVMFKGYLEVPKAGVYTFTLRQFCVGQFFVGDRLIIDQLPGGYAPQWKEQGAPIALAAGKYPITLAVKIFDDMPELSKDLITYSVGGAVPAPIAAARLSHDTTPGWTLPVPAPVQVQQRPEALDALKQVEVSVVALKDGKSIKSFTLPLDANGRGQSRFKLPELADGQYIVQWKVAGKLVQGTQTFLRKHFPFEKNELGLDHTVYPPFTPVEVKGDQVSVVDRNYTINSLGLFSSVISKGKELLAQPMKLVVEDKDDKPIEWKPGEVAGKVAYPDLAQFQGTATSDLGNLKSSVSVEEDGCAKVNWQIDPAATPMEVGKMYLEIELPDAMAPLFHYTGIDSPRHNYAGNTPRGGKIIWDVLPPEAQGYVPTIWKAEPGPADGIIWDSNQILHFGSTRENFCPYIWLGAEERGLAWFAGTDHGYINDGLEPVQTVSRVGDKVVLRIYFIQQPTTVVKPLNYTFGLQASPTKPLRADFRTHKVPGGSGCIVNVWGGYLCSDKYPDGGDFTIVDKIQEGRKTGKVDEEYFKAKDKARAWPDMKVQFDAPWLEYALLFAKFAADACNRGAPAENSVTYFEEHAVWMREMEWQVFQDEWAVFEFIRFRPDDGNYSQAARSYRDFALYFANEWMRRGISLYFDNTMYRVVTNPYNQDFAGRTFTIWDQRDYYKRIWKDMSRLNTTKETPYELDFTGHITNTQTIPDNTWFTGALDLEQDYRVDKTRKPPEWMAQHGVFRLPFPPDYTRTMTMSRTVGVTPHIMSMLTNFASNFVDPDFLAKMPATQWRSELGMRLVHEITISTVRPPSAPPTWNLDVSGQRLVEYLAWFGYGKPDVTVHNYWEDKPFVTVSDPEVTWLAMTRPEAPQGFLLLQSYKPDPVTVTVKYPDGLAMMDLFSHELFTADAKGVVTIPMAGIYGTRALAVAKDVKELPPASLGEIVKDGFELGISSPLWLRNTKLKIVDDEAKPGNHVLRIKNGDATQDRVELQPAVAKTTTGDTKLSFRFRLPSVPTSTGASYGVLSAMYRYDGELPHENAYDLRLQVKHEADGTAEWVVEQIRALRDNKEEPFTDLGKNLLGQPIPGLPVDTNWHRLTIENRGTRQVISLDDTVVFEGTSEASKAGYFSIGAGWGMDPTLPYFDLDDITFQKL